MAALTHFLPRHFHSHLPSSPKSHAASHAHPASLNVSYASTASDSSSESPASSSLSPLLPKRHLSLPLPSHAALLPSPPSLARESNQTPAAPQPHPPRPLFVNTSITHPPPSSSPASAASSPSLSAMSLTDGRASAPSTPMGTDDPPALPSYSPSDDADGVMDDGPSSHNLLTRHPPSPVLPRRTVPIVTPPPSPSAPSTAFPSAPTPSLSSQLASTFRVEPSLPELLASISMVLHVQLIKDEASPAQAKLRLPDFREEGAAAADASSTPSVRAIYHFLLHVFQRGRFSSELGLLALVYVHRVMAGTGVSLTAINYRPLLMVALCLAQKMWDDTPLINGDFRILYPQLRDGGKSAFLAKFNRLEALLCEALTFNFLVTHDTYSLYLQELQAIWAEYEQGHHQQGNTHPITGDHSPAPSAGSPPKSPGTADAASCGVSSPMKDRAGRASCRRHHPYAGPALEDRRLHRMKQQLMDCASDQDSQGSDSDGERPRMPGGWDPSVLTVPGTGVRAMAEV